MNRVIFNDTQRELLSAMSVLNTEEDLFELKQILSNFFAKRADEEMERLWDSGAWNEQTLNDLKTAHYRTPYK